MNMFDWLQQQRSEIRTPKFLVLESTGLSDREVLPEDYQTFRLTVGSLKCFRVGLDRYQMVLFKEPRVQRIDNTDFLRIGFCEVKGTAFLRMDQVASNETAHVFEGSSSRFPRDSGMTFAEWLRKRFRELRASYPNATWKEICNGPAPFDAAEQQVVLAREFFDWSRVGTTPTDDILIDVHNRSKMLLPGLTVGVQSERLNGAVCLPVQTIAPGTARTINIDCYKSLVSPTAVKIVKLPPPGPEDRMYYYEFGMRVVKQ